MANKVLDYKIIFENKNGKPKVLVMGKRQGLMMGLASIICTFKEEQNINLSEDDIKFAVKVGLTPDEEITDELRKEIKNRLVEKIIKTAEDKLKELKGENNE